MEARELTVMFVALGVLLGCARLLGELARRFQQPTVVGEILAGILLGPSVLGTLLPEWQAYLFPRESVNAHVLDAIAALSIALYLLVAGMEVDLSTVWRQGRAALSVGTVGMLVPFLLGGAVAWAAPRAVGLEGDVAPWVFALFVATALAISALPVIARTLMDLGLYRSDLGMVVISAAVFNDVIGWTLFAVILGCMGANAGQEHTVAETIALTMAFALGMLTVGRWAIDRILPYIQAYSRGPVEVLSFSLTLALLGAAFTEWIGIHAIFGSFLVGVAIGDSAHLRERTRATIGQFVSFIFAPVFFASIGLKVNFFTNFDLLLVLLILVVACVGKLSGAALGARWGGMIPRDSWAVGFAMNARGAMEIVLGVLALQHGLIGERLFVALVLMAVATSMISGPCIQIILGHRKPQTLLDAFAPRLFVRPLTAVSRREAIRELVTQAQQDLDRDVAAAESLVWAREKAQPTGIGNGLALPHASFKGLRQPLAVVGISEAGVDFDAPDGRPAHVIVLLLTSGSDPAAPLELTAELERVFRDEAILDQILRTRNYTEFLALIRIATSE